MTRLEEASLNVAQYIDSLSECGLAKVMCTIAFPTKCLYCVWAENEEQCLKKKCEDGIKKYLEAGE